MNDRVDEAAQAYVKGKHNKDYGTAAFEGFDGLRHIERRYDCCSGVAQSTRATPYIEDAHIRTSRHIAHQYGVSRQQLLGRAREILQWQRRWMRSEIEYRIETEGATWVRVRVAAADYLRVREGRGAPDGDWNQHLYHICRRDRRPCCATIPIAAYRSDADPYSELTHAKTVEHIAAVHAVPKKDMLREVRLRRKEKKGTGGTQCPST